MFGGEWTIFLGKRARVACLPVGDLIRQAKRKLLNGNKWVAHEPSLWSSSSPIA